MRMNEISWQRKVYMNHSANVVPAGKPYKKQMLQGKVFPVTKAQARNFVLMGCLLNELNNEDVRVVELILNKHGIVGNYSYAKKKGMVRLVNSCDLDNALRGEEGEAINARKAMVRLCSTLGVNLEDILNESEQKKEYVFNVGCDHLLKELFFMCSEKILGDGEIWYKEKNSHISLELTPSQYAELFTYFDFHKENFKKELKATRKRLLLAYLLKHNIYVGNDDGTDKELSSEERRNAWKTLQMVDGLENVSYLKSLEDK